MPATDLSSAGRRLRRQERKREAEEREPLARRRAYLAAQEVLEQGLALWKQADNKARLALMLLGPLNVVLLALLSHGDLFVDLSPLEQFWILTGIIVYTGLAMTMFLLAIYTLRPEEATPVVHPSGRDRRHELLGIRHYEDVLGWDLDEYQRAWRYVTREQLVEEVAEQAHAVAEANRRKFRTLDSLFRGLFWMTVLAVVLVFVIAAGVLVEHHGENRGLLNLGLKTSKPSPPAAGALRPSHVPGA